MSQLPNGWVRAPLKSLLSSDGIFSDGDWIESKDQDPNGSIRLLQLADIGDGYFVDKSSRFINEEKFAALNCTELKAGDVLIARMPDPLGRACLLPEMPQTCITVVDVAVFRTGEKGASNKWLMNVINSPQLRAFMETNSSGTTRKRISRGKLTDMELPVPPLLEQKRIADKLDAVLARVDICRERLSCVPLILKRFRQSVLGAATSGKLTEDWRTKQGVNWSVSLFQDLLAKEDGSIRRGPFGSAIKKSFFVRDGYKVYEQKNAIQDDPDLGEYYIDEKKFHELEGFSVRGGDFIVSCAGTIGRISQLPTQARPGVINQALMRVRLDADIVDSSYFLLLFRSPVFQAQILEQTQGSAMQNMAAIKVIRQISIRIPSLKEQYEIVRRVETLFAYADRLEARYQSARVQVTKLTPALLVKAFRGELVPQDPMDEPASELIKCIASERAMNAKLPKNVTRKRKGTVSMKPKNIISVTEVLRSAVMPLTAQELLIGAGYTLDAKTELVEQFFLDIRKELENKRIVRFRKGNDDFFSIV